jgi:hypothetical protein
LAKVDLLRIYLIIGVVIAVFAFHSLYAWDWIRGIAVIAAAVNAGVSGQIALCYTNGVFPLNPRGPSPSAYWLGALAMLLLALGMILGSASRAGQPPTSQIGLSVLMVAFVMLAVFSAVVLRSLRRLGEPDE